MRPAPEPRPAPAQPQGQAQPQPRHEPAHMRPIGDPAHIAGQGKANPLAMILSAAMMLDWLAERLRISGPRVPGASSLRPCQAR